MRIVRYLTPRPPLHPMERGRRDRDGGEVYSAIATSAFGEVTGPHAEISADCLCGLEGPATREHGEPGKEALELRWEEAHTPVERDGEAAMARGGVSLPPDEEGEP